MASINHNLNLVMTVERGEDEPPLYVHSVPVSNEVFETYWRVLNQTYVEMAATSLQTGIKIAALALRNIAQEQGIWTKMGEQPGVQNGLVEEMRRLTNVVVPTDNGWSTLPLSVAVKQGHVDAETAKEVDNITTFFTVAWHMFPRLKREAFLKDVLKSWDVQTTSLDCTEYANSLTQSTRKETSEADESKHHAAHTARTKAGSSVPS